MPCFEFLPDNRKTSFIYWIQNIHALKHSTKYRFQNPREHLRNFLNESLEIDKW